MLKNFCCGVTIIWMFSMLLNGISSHESKLTNWIKRANVTEIACEGQKAVLSCDEGDGIKMKSAFWGRNDTKLCPPPSNTNKTNNLCKPYNPKYPQEKLESICDGLPRCEVHASEAYFEIPLCKGNSKYLRVVYDCRAMSGLGSR